MNFSGRKNNFPHTLLIKECEEKKSKCVENGHSKLKITRKIMKFIVGLDEQLGFLYGFDTIFLLNCHSY